LANHGYINRDGVASLLPVVGAINEVCLRLASMDADWLADALQVFGMDIGLATVLSTMGTVWTGDPLSLSPGFSIDGYHPKVMNLLGNLLGLLGKPRGVSVLLIDARIAFHHMKSKVVQWAIS
jgi:hypothetical protein